MMKEEEKGVKRGREGERGGERGERGEGGIVEEGRKERVGC